MFQKERFTEKNVIILTFLQISSNVKSWTQLILIYLH